LAAGLAHEIRNPIAAMRLKAENALAVDDKERPVVALQFILQQIARLDGLLRDLLAMTQRREPKLTENDLAAFLERAADAYRELAASKGVKLVVGPAPPGATPPLFDAEQMHRALDNLILNAIESTPAGGTIDVQAKRRTNALQICVSDSGPGVPPDLRERLFEPFVTGRSDGTGLGLAAVRDIARAHGGDARLVPTSRGAQFEIEVPWPKS
jgi:signal transduction histidine kinase